MMPGMQSSATCSSLEARPNNCDQLLLVLETTARHIPALLLGKAQGPRGQIPGPIVQQLNGAGDKPGSRSSTDGRSRSLAQAVRRMLWHAGRFHACNYHDNNIAAPSNTPLSVSLPHCSADSLPPLYGYPCATMIMLVRK